MSIWYALIRTPAPAVHLFELGEVEDPGPVWGQRREGICAELGVPDEWINVPGWDVSLLEGEPHPSLLAVAILHPLPADPPEEG